MAGDGPPPPLAQQETVQLFLDGDSTAKRSLVRGVVHGWLGGDASAPDALHQLIDSSKASPARLDLIDGEVAQTLLGSLASPDWQERAAQVTTEYIGRMHPEGSAALTAALRTALELDAEPATREPLLSGIERLADCSTAFRMPAMLGKLIESRLDRLNSDAISLALARSVFNDVERLKVHLKRSPYEGALQQAFHHNRLHTLHAIKQAEAEASKAETEASKAEAE